MVAVFWRKVGSIFCWLKDFLADWLSWTSLLYFVVFLLFLFLSISFFSLSLSLSCLFSFSFSVSLFWFVPWKSIYQSTKSWGSRTWPGLGMPRPGQLYDGRNYFLSLSLSLFFYLSLAGRTIPFWWHSGWHIFWQSVWHIFWHYFWHIYLARPKGPL